jgi:hypothetical protein
MEGVPRSNGQFNVKMTLAHIFHNRVLGLILLPYDGGLAHQ